MNELVGTLVKQLGVQEGQAAGGAGLLLKLAKDKLGAADWQKVAGAVGGADQMVQAAPRPGGAAGLLGGLASAMGASKLGDLASLAGGFESLGLNKDMIAKFTPVVLSFIQSKAGGDILAMVTKALKG